MKINDIRNSELFNSISDNCIVRIGSYFVRNHNINIYFNSQCLDMLIHRMMCYLIVLIESSKPYMTNTLFTSFLDYINKYKDDVNKEDLIYLKNIINIIIDTIIFTLKTNHSDDDINNVIEYYTKYSTCDDVLYVCRGIILRLEEE